ncbi:glucose PTS transporter subunit IIA [Lactiplantibacillus sp. WILCCON 0030]|uniref:Glucose PTS transporter subunit IIA n=1 Tax=Lactiplantibacillus brownii TaxID=3069269 RepID=A0ABU1A774_9LACO|nr:glucose PTS transporter subunit IIA [Lactiplantibacillus brownii]MDQ7936774.1 glucose PTS transporter subunit IIA [Lactiplantibacillus brownii]
MSKALKTPVSEIVKLVGGKANIDSATHCITRLRLVLKDKKAVDLKGLDQIDLVQGTNFVGDQFQIIIGPSVGKVYDEFMAQIGEIKPSTTKPTHSGNWLQRLVSLLGDIFIPIIPAIVAAGLLMGVNNVLGNQGIFYPKASFIQMHTEWKGVYDIIQLIAQTSFAFLPALIGWSAVKRFKGNPLLGIVLGLILVNPSLMSAYDYAANPAKAPTWNIFGWHVAQVGYQGQVIPVLVAAWLLVKLEKYFEKHIPDALQLVLVAPLALLISGFASFLFIGPVTMAGANVITSGVVNLFNAAPVIGGALYGFICAPLVITGMHHLFLGVNLQMAGTLGYVTLWPVGEPVTMAQGAACLAMTYIFRKDAKKKNVAWTSGLSSFLGITEPAIYGVNLKNRYPFVAVMLAGAIGGGWMGFWHVRSTSVGVGGVLSFLSVFPKQWGLYLTGEVMTFVLTIVFTLLLMHTKLNPAKNAKAGATPKQVPTDLMAYVDGKTMPITEVKDTMFSQKQLGDGVATTPTGEQIYAPAAGVISALMPHAVGMTLDNGMEILIHIGLETVNLKGRGFETSVTQGQRVTAGTKLIHFDDQLLKKEGYDDSVMMVVTNQGNLVAGVDFKTHLSHVQVGEPIANVSYLPLADVDAGGLEA